MKLKMLLLTFLTTIVVEAQSFYVLSDVKNYDTLVVSESAELKPYNDEIKKLMEAMSLELNIDTQGHPSRVLAFIINKFSLGDTLGVKVVLELGEYVRRKGAKEEVFAISYVDVKMFPYTKEDLEDDLADTVEEMIETFSIQYKEDNKKLSNTKKSVTHETFAKDMAYENEYKIALVKAKKEGKNLMVFMTTSYCPWCRKLENQILSQEHIDSKIKKNHIPVMLNYDKKKFPKKLGKIGVTPTLYIVNAKTEKIEETFIGFSSRSEFLHYLKTKDEK
jgi:thiol-disulfide isomerase/thioredoxin